MKHLQEEKIYTMPNGDDAQETTTTEEVSEDIVGPRPGDRE